MKYTNLILCLLFLFSCSNQTDKQEQSNYIKNLENRIEIQEQNNYIRSLEERLKKLESSSNVRTGTIEDAAEQLDEPVENLRQDGDIFILSIGGQEIGRYKMINGKLEVQ